MTLWSVFNRLRSPDPVGLPVLALGALVRLKRKPDRPRRILRIEWHKKLRAWTYVVETKRRHPPGFEPKFTAEELATV